MIEIYTNLEKLSNAAALLFAEQVERAVAARGRFSVALSGGDTPRHAYELLAQPPFRDRVPWANVHVFWGDERCVPADDPRSNFRLAPRRCSTMSRSPRSRFIRFGVTRNRTKRPSVMKPFSAPPSRPCRRGWTSCFSDWARTAIPRRSSPARPCWRSGNAGWPRSTWLNRTSSA